MMTEQEFRKLKPLDLIQILLAQSSKVMNQKEELERKNARLEALREENDSIKDELNSKDAEIELIKEKLNEGDARIRELEMEAEGLHADKLIELEEAGSLVQAALELNKIFEAAQREAEQYVSNFNTGQILSNMQSGLNSSMQSGINKNMQSGINNNMQGGINSSRQSGLNNSMQGGINSSMYSGINNSMHGGMNGGMRTGTDGGMQHGVQNRADARGLFGEAGRYGQFGGSGQYEQMERLKKQHQRQIERSEELILSQPQSLREFFKKRKKQER